jgi:hypothetical protein
MNFYTFAINTNQTQANMKKTFIIMACIGLSVTAASAQSSGVPSFSSGQEKDAWIKAIPEAYRLANEESAKQFVPAQMSAAPANTVGVSRSASQSGTPARATYVGELNKEVFESDAAKEEWLLKNATPAKD